MKTAEEFLVERFDKDGIGAPPKHVYESITKVMEEYAEAKAGQHETIVMRTLKKYVKYINDVEGADYITIHDERPFSDVDFTSEEWGLLKEIMNEMNELPIGTNDNTAGNPASSAVETIVMWFKTVGKPKERCKFFGHKMTTRNLRVRKKGGFMAVVTDYKAKKTFCTRCRKGINEIHDLEEFRSFNSCSMPSDMWDEIREKGWVEV